ncbi:hypothetical protein F4809DRAFT_362313 [Biscogniauxia mediterranea]|nr:hypothetical protein F4809DRAFT_362313 [Biscogniauxia mediterranea]
MLKLNIPWMKKSGPEYTSLPDDEEAKSSDHISDIKPGGSVIYCSRWLVSGLFNTVMALLALYGLFSLFRAVIPAQPRSCNCGETVEEARANGCVYDSLAAAWLPPHCRSAAITEDFESAGPNEPDQWGNTWSYWADKNKTQPMTLEEVSMLPESARRGGQMYFYSTHEWHVKHCIYYWRKMWESSRRARGFPGSAGEAGELVIEKRYDTLMHIEHCMAMLMKQGVPLDSVAAEAGVALHSDEIHIAKPHQHQNDEDDPYDKMKTGAEHEHERAHEHHQDDPYEKMSHARRMSFS